MANEKNSKIEKKSKSIIEVALEIQGQTALEAGEVNFVSLNFIQTILPHSAIEGNSYKRENGFYKLFIASEHSVPYGTIPRMILSWVVTEAIRTSSREIYIGNNLSQFMKKVGLPTDGRTMARFKEQSKALFNSYISVGYDDGEKSDHKNILIATGVQFWWNEDEKNNQKNLFSSKITLSEEFFALIKKYHIPVDLRAIKVLKQSSLAFDVYSWLTYRYYSLKERAFISFEALQFQFGSGYDMNNRNSRSTFRRNFKETLKRIKILYPNAKFEVQKDGIVLYPSPTHIPRRNSKIKQISDS